MKKLLASLVVALALVTPALAQPPYCILGGDTPSINIRVTPAGPVTGQLFWGTAVRVQSIAPPWLYVSTWTPSGFVPAGWVWGRFIDPDCYVGVPVAVAPVVVAPVVPAPAPAPFYREEYRYQGTNIPPGSAAPAPHYRDKGDYQDQPPATQAPPQQYEQAPMPENAPQAQPQAYTPVYVPQCGAYGCD